MADFSSEFWSWYIVVLTVLGIAACFWLLSWSSKGASPVGTESEDTGHVWDSDLTELNNPLPRWWLGLFYITLFFSMGYLVLYPGLGSFQGWLGWSSANSYDEEIKQADEKYGPLFAKFQAQELTSLAQDKQAQKMGERLFLNHCATCHGSDARGARGFPNLRDGDWLWGGTADAIKQSIQLGRNGAMPAWGLALGGEQGVSDMTDYVLSLASRDHDVEAASRGQEKFNLFCAACHTPAGTGNQALGAPNLTDDIWLYGGSRAKIAETLDMGRQGKMPAYQDFLGDDKTHILAAYIYSLSQK